MMIASVLMLSVVPCTAGPGDDAVCTALLEDERTQMADYDLDVELGQLRLAAFEKIYELVDGLRKHEAIEQMAWLKARHDRDAARLELDLTPFIPIAGQYRVRVVPTAGRVEVGDEVLLQAGQESTPGTLRRTPGAKESPDTFDVNRTAAVTEDSDVRLSLVLRGRPCAGVVLIRAR